MTTVKSAKKSAKGAKPGKSAKAVRPAAPETVPQIVAELKSLGSPSIKKVLMNHGAREPFYGVKIEHLKKLQKRIKQNHELALGLYATGISDAMYLAGLIAQPERMTKRELAQWMKGAYWDMLSSSVVAPTAAASQHGPELALEWIEAKDERIAAAGWSTLSSLVSLKPDDELEVAQLKRLLQRVEKSIHQAPNRVRYAMNGFVIAAGCFVAPLTAEAKRVAAKVGKVEVDMGNTSCQVPFAPDYIAKVEARGTIGKKRKTAMC
jgi:3-methyladenine DNA glycosylase AlkD